jgi:hypothetical protein
MEAIEGEDSPLDFNKLVPEPEGLPEGNEWHMNPDSASEFLVEQKESTLYE